MKIYANGTQAIEYVVKNSVDIMQRYDGLMETQAREIVRSIVRAYEVDRFLGTVQLVRNSRELARAMMFETGQFDSQFVNIVGATSTMHTLGDCSETGFGRKNVSDDERRAHDTLSKLRLDLNVASVSIDAAYTEFRKYNQLVRTGLTDDAAKRLPVWLPLLKLRTNGCNWRATLRKLSRTLLTVRRSAIGWMQLRWCLSMIAARKSISAENANGNRLLNG